MSAKTHAGNISVIDALDLCPFDTQNKRFPRLIGENFYVKVGDFSCIGF